MRLGYPVGAALAVLGLGAAIALSHGLLAEPGTVAAATAATGSAAPDPGREGSAPGTVAPTPSGIAPYVGTWRVHGAELTIRPDGTATDVIRLGPCLGLAAGVNCTATGTLRIAPGADPPELVYTAFRYADDTGATVRPDSLAGLPVVGDGYRLRVHAPGVLELVPLTDHLRQIMGSPYRCSTAADEYARQRLCNA